MADTARTRNQRDTCRRICRARCCRYITARLPAPRLKADYDEISWFLAHDHISVYFHNRRWHLEVRTRCRHLTPANLCAIYHTRPIVCRGYDTEECEYPARPKHDLHFDTQVQFDTWWADKLARTRLRRRQQQNSPRSTA